MSSNGIEVSVILSPEECDEILNVATAMDAFQKIRVAVQRSVNDHTYEKWANAQNDDYLCAIDRTLDAITALRKGGYTNAAARQCEALDNLIGDCTGLAANVNSSEICKILLAGLE